MPVPQEKRDVHLITDQRILSCSKVGARSSIGGYARSEAELEQIADSLQEQEVRASAEE